MKFFNGPFIINYHSFSGTPSGSLHLLNGLSYPTLFHFNANLRHQVVELFVLLNLKCIVNLMCISSICSTLNVTFNNQLGGLH